MTIPQNGRYVIRTQFAAFAQGSGEALLNATNHDQAVNFDLMLASRAARQEQQQAAAQGGDDATQAIRQMAGNGPQNLSLMSAVTGDTEAGGASGESGAALPSAAGNSEFSSESVNVNGQAGQVSPMAGLNMDRIRDAMEDARVMNGGIGFGGRGAMMMGGPGGFGGGGGFFRGRGNFRGFNPAQPHGSVYWTGSNFSQLDAEPFSLLGQPQVQVQRTSRHAGARKSCDGRAWIIRNGASGGGCAGDPERGRCSCPAVRRVELGLALDRSDRARPRVLSVGVGDRRAQIARPLGRLERVAQTRRRWRS